MNEKARTNDYQEEVLEALAAAAPAEANLNLPPAVFEELRPRILDYVPRKLITLTFAAEPRFGDPRKYLSGAYFTMTFDLAFSMLALLTARRPCACLTLNTSFIRPLPADEAPFTVEARVRALTGSVLFLEAKASNEDDKTLVTATSTMNVLKSTR